MNRADENLSAAVSLPPNLGAVAISGAVFGALVGFFAHMGDTKHVMKHAVVGATISVAPALLGYAVGRGLVHLAEMQGAARRTTFRGASVIDAPQEVQESVRYYPQW